jgi:hypothetical protein
MSPISFLLLLPLSFRVGVVITMSDGAGGLAGDAAGLAGAGDAATAPASSSICACLISRLVIRGVMGVPGVPGEPAPDGGSFVGVCMTGGFAFWGVVSSTGSALGGVDFVGVSFVVGGMSESLTSAQKSSPAARTKLQTRHRYALL